MVVLHLEQVNHKQVVRNKLNSLLGFLAVLIFFCLDEVHAAVLAVAVTAWWHWAFNCVNVFWGIAVFCIFKRKEFFFNKVFAYSGHRDDLLCVVGFDLTPKNQRVCDLPPVRTRGTDAGVQRVHCRAGVRPFYLSQLLIHPVRRVWVQLRQPHSFLSTIITDLRPRQQRSPDRFFAVLFGCGDIVSNLGAMRLELIKDCAAVLHYLYLSHSLSVFWPRPRQHNRVRLWYCFFFEVGVDDFSKRIEVKQVAFHQQLYRKRYSILLLVVHSARHTHQPRRICGDIHVDDHAFLFAQEFYVLRNRSPFSNRHVACHRPIAVKPTTRTNNPRLAELVQPDLDHECVQRQHSFFLRCVTIQVNKERLYVCGFVSLTLVAVETRDRIEDVAMVSIPTVYVGLQFLNCVLEHMLFFSCEFYRTIRA